MVRAPYFVVEGNDLGAYADYDAKERHLEPIDVRAGVYRLFDPAGPEMSLSVVKRTVNVGKPIGSDPGFLKQTLIKYLSAVGRQWGIDVAHLSQADLPTVAAAFAGRIQGASERKRMGGSAD